MPRIASLSSSRSSTGRTYCFLTRSNTSPNALSWSTGSAFDSSPDAEPAESTSPGRERDRPDDEPDRPGTCVHRIPLAFATRAANIPDPPGSRAGSVAFPHFGYRASMEQFAAFALDNAVLVLVFLGLLAALVWTSISTTGAGQVSPADAVRLISREDAVVIDLRPDGEYRNGHIVNAVHVPFDRSRAVSAGWGGIGRSR